MKIAYITLGFATLTVCTKEQENPFSGMFDNPPLIAGVLPDLRDVDGTAGGALFYNAAGYSNFELSNLTIRPPSSPYTIYNGATSELKEGQPAFLPMYNLSFIEKSISYACIVATRTGQLNVATTCTIQLTGVVVGSGNTVIQELPFNPELLGDAFDSTTFAASFISLSRMNNAVVLLWLV